MTNKNLLLFGVGLAVAGVLIFKYKNSKEEVSITNGEEEVDLEFPIYPTEGCSYDQGSQNFDCESNNYVKNVQKFFEEQGLIDENTADGYFDFDTGEVLSEYLSQLKDYNADSYYALGYNDTDNANYITRAFHDQMP